MRQFDHIMGEGLQQLGARPGGASHMSAFKPRGGSALPKISNRERQRRAAKAIGDAVAAELLVKLLLAQAGGEVTISRGTSSQVTADSTIDVRPNPKVEGEVIIQLLLGKDEATVIMDDARIQLAQAQEANDVSEAS